MNWFYREAQSNKEQALKLLNDDKEKLEEVKKLLFVTEKPFRHYAYARLSNNKIVIELWKSINKDIIEIINKKAQCISI